MIFCSHQGLKTQRNQHIWGSQIFLSILKSIKQVFYTIVQQFLNFLVQTEPFEFVFTFKFGFKLGTRIILKFAHTIRIRFLLGFGEFIWYFTQAMTQ